MAVTEIQIPDGASRRLLEEGARSYLGAMTALVAYQKEVQKKCRAVMEDCLKDYAFALKVSLRSDEIQEVAYPSITKWEGNWWSLGVKIVRKDIPRISYWESGCCLQYESARGLYCWIGEYFTPKGLAESLYSKFHRVNSRVIAEGNDVWLESGLKVEETPALEENLEKLFRQWAELWTKVGGIKEVLKATAGG